MEWLIYEPLSIAKLVRRSMDSFLLVSKCCGTTNHFFTVFFTQFSLVITSHPQCYSNVDSELELEGEFSEKFTGVQTHTTSVALL